jgi:hypothetical protein
VTVGGRPIVGDPDLAAVFRARRVKLRPLCVDAARSWPTPAWSGASLVARSSNRA